MGMRRCDADEHYYDDSVHLSCPYCRGTVFLKPEQKAEAEDEALAGTSMPVHTQIFGVEKEQIPCVGWLVVMSSPKSPNGKDNKGRDLRLIPGMNRVGRNANMEVSTDFGDNKIGRDSHCAITYDPESNAFFVQSGDGRNLTYVYRAVDDDGLEEGVWDVVLQPRALMHLDRIKLGDTIFLFVPLCGSEFTWDFSE